MNFDIMTPLKYVFYFFGCLFLAYIVFFTVSSAIMNGLCSGLDSHFKSMRKNLIKSIQKKEEK